METEHATQLAQMKLDAAVERSLTAAKAKNTKAARSAGSERRKAGRERGSRRTFRKN